MFASEADYIFYALSVTQNLKLISLLNIALKNFSSGHVTAKTLSSNFTETVKPLLTKMHTSPWVISKAHLIIGKSFYLTF